MTFIEPTTVTSPKRPVIAQQSEAKLQFREAYNVYCEKEELNGTGPRTVADALNTIIPLAGLGALPNPITAADIQNYLAYTADSPSPSPQLVKGMEIVSEGFLKSCLLSEVWQDTELTSERGEILDQARLKTTLQAWQERYGMNQTTLAEQCYVPRSTINRLETGNSVADSRQTTLLNVSGFFDLKWRAEAQKGKDYVPGKALLEQWQKEILQGGEDHEAQAKILKAIIRREMNARNIEVQHFAMPYLQREIINKWLSKKNTDHVPAESSLARLARVFDYLDLRRELGEGVVPPLMGMGTEDTEPVPAHICQEVQTQGKVNPPVVDRGK